VELKFASHTFLVMLNLFQHLLRPWNAVTEGQTSSG